MSNNNKAPILIIGTGLAGISLAKELRKLTAEPIVMITKDDGFFYSKPLLSTAFSQQKSAEDLVVTSKTALETQLNLTILDFTVVDSLCFDSRVAQLSKDRQKLEQKFSQLIFALGAKPKPLPVLEGVPHYRINNLLDYRLFRRRLDLVNTLTIIGSGLVGCEFAHDFSQAGKSIQVISIDAHPLYRLVPEAMGIALQQQLTQNNVEWHCATSIKSIHQSAQHFDIELNNHTQLQSDLILAAIGLNPDTALAHHAGVHCEQGIVVDDYLQTNQPDCYALGDCAQIQNQCRQFVAPILQCARALAQTMTGNPTQVHLPVMPVTIKTASYPIITHPPLANENGAWTTEISSGGIKAQYCSEDGILKGYALSGDQLNHRANFSAQMLKKIPETPTL